MATTEDGRDASGRFAPGNGGGPGRPRRIVEQTYMRALRDAMSPEDFGRVVAKALEQALQGDSTARAWLGRYALGADPPSLRQLAGLEDAAGSVDEAVERSIKGGRLLGSLAIDAGAL